MELITRNTQLEGIVIKNIFNSVTTGQNHY